METKTIETGGLDMSKVPRRDAVSQGVNKRRSQNIVIDIESEELTYG